MAPRQRGGITRVQDIAETVENGDKTQSSQQTRKKFAKFGHGKSIAKHGMVEAVEEAEEPHSRGRSGPHARAGRTKPAASREPSKDKESPPAPTLRRSPRKKLVGDEPRVEDTADPFPPPRPPMLVTDKPAVINQYGEKVPAPVDADQRLRQAFFFLSDEGPENCRDFEERLDRLEKWLRKHHPNWEGVTEDGNLSDSEMLARKVEWAIWVHRNRLEEGSEEWFTAHRFPNSAYKKPIPGSDRWQAINKGVFMGAPKYPKLQVLLLKDAENKKKAEAHAKSAEAKAAKARDTARSASTDSWDEPLPRPEVWHRKEAARFPFGETPNIEALMSKEISDDLAKGMTGTGNKTAESSWNLNLFNFMSASTNDEPVSEEWPIKRKSPWKLPDVSDEEVNRVLESYTLPGSTDGKKRKATAGATSAASKRSRAG